NEFLAAVNGLVNERLVQEQLAALQPQDQIAIPIDLKFLHAFEGQPHLTWIGTWCNKKIVLQLALVSIKHQIYAWINLVVLHMGVLRDVRSSPARVASNQ